MLRVIGLDPSLTVTAAVLLEEFKVCQTGTFEPKTRNTERLVEIREAVSLFIDLYRPELIAIEGYSFGSHNRASIAMGELGGVLRALFFDLKIDWIEVSPTQLKRFATGHGNAAKDLVLKEVYRRFEVDFPSTHLAEAFVLARIGSHVLAHLDGKEHPTMTVFQIETIKKILKSYTPKFLQACAGLRNFTEARHRLDHRL